MNAGTFNWFTSLWTTLATPIQNAEQPLVSVLQSYVTGWFQLAVAAYLVCLMLIASWSADESSSLHFFRQLFLATVVYGLAATSTAFNTYVSGLANGIVTGVTTAMAGVFGGLPVTSAGVFDAAANNLLSVGIAVMNHVPQYGYVAGLLLGAFCDLYMFVSVLIIGFVFFLYLLSDVILGFLIAFGPLFIACYFFPFTRQFCDGWVRTVVAALVTKIFITGLMTLFTAVIMTFVGTITNTIATTKGSGTAPGDIFSPVVGLIATIAACFGLAFLGFEAAKLAQSIAGGAHAHFSKLPALPSPSGSRASSGGGEGSKAAPGFGGASHTGVTSATEPARNFPFNRNVGSSDN